MARARSLVVVCVFVCVVACGGARPPSSTAPADTCPPAPAGRSVAPATPRPLPALDLPRSAIVVHVDLAMGALERELEVKVPKRVAEERDHDLGMAGRLEYTVDRGAFAVSVQGDALVVETPLVGHARACAKGRCYAGCNPEARATARVPLRLDASYKLGPSSVRIDVTRGCEVRALGGMVKIDVTPTLTARLAQEKRRIEQSIDRELPDLRPQAERMWAGLSRPQGLPLGACVALAPEGLVQGPASGAGKVAKLRFGLLAKPELRMRCGQPPAAKPLPPLGTDPALAEDGVVHLAIVMPGEAAARALDGVALDLGRARSRVRASSGDVATGLLVDLGGEACGEYRCHPSALAWTPDAKGVHLAGVAIAEPDLARVASAGLDAPAFTAALEQATIQVPIALGDLATTLPELARGLSDDRVNVSATIKDAQPGAAGFRGIDLVAVAKLRGAVTVQPR